MNDIKTIEVTKPIYGLEVGDVLSRQERDMNFFLNTEEISEDRVFCRNFILSPNMINGEHFQVTEWFNNKKTKSQKIVELKKELEEYKNRDNNRDQYLIELEKSITDLSNRHRNLLNRINTKLDEFNVKLNIKLNDGSCQECNREELTVLNNMIDLLEKIKA